MTILCTLFGIYCTAGQISGAAYVHDGDTIYINEQPVRLMGVDAEELDEPHGHAARDHLRRLTTGLVVTCDWQGYSYKRVVGVCYAGGYSLNAAMIRDGQALDCYRYSGGLYRYLEPPGARDRLLQKGYCK